MIPFKQRKQAQQILEAFTRQHYIAIAEIIKRQVSDAKSAGDPTGYVRDIAEDLAALFKKDNPGFDKSRFLQACGF